MTQTVFTNYWIDKRNDVRKEHASFKTEEEALEAIRTWWEIKKEDYDSKVYRTNTGALEIDYGFDDYFYRIEEREIDGELPTTSYKLMNQNEIDAKRRQLDLDEDYYLFDELAEPRRDRLITAMGDVQKSREWAYMEYGDPVVKLKSLK